MHNNYFIELGTNNTNNTSVNNTSHDKAKLPIQKLHPLYSQCYLARTGFLYNALFWTKTVC